MKLTAQLQLLTTEEQSKTLQETLVRCNQACDWLSQVAWETRTFGRNKLHLLTYTLTREQFGLSAQATVRCIGKVVDSYKLDKKTRRSFRADGAIAYDSRLLTYCLDKREVSIWSLGGRLRIPFVCGEHQWEQLQQQQGESDLCLVDSRFYLLATCEQEEQVVQRSSGVLGVDMGIVNLATDSDGQFYGHHVREIRRKRQKTRKDLQKRKSKSAKRKLKKRRRKERRFRQDVNHCIAKKLVQKAKRTNRAIALENLKGIRTRVRASRQLRQELHSWAFYDLQIKIQYKAELAGVPVFKVNPAYTSRGCHVCGHCEKRNRKNQSEFSCVACGHQSNADVNAARNIKSKGAVNLPQGVQLKLF